MHRTKIIKLYELLGKKLATARKRAEELHEAATEIGRVAYNSPSQAGDRYHAEGQAEIAKESAKSLEKIFEEFRKELKAEMPKSIRPVCWVEIEYSDAKREGFFFLHESPPMQGFKFVSANSPFGTILLGKHIGQKFEFKTPVIKKVGRVVKIE